MSTLPLFAPIEPATHSNRALPFIRPRRPSAQAATLYSSPRANQLFLSLSHKHTLDGKDGWSIHTGSCGYGYLDPNKATGACSFFLIWP